MTTFRPDGKKLLSLITHTAALVLGTFLVAAGTVLFFAPNRIVCGGVSGISTVLFHTLSIPISVSYAAINVILLLLGLKALGKEFIIKTVLGTVLVTVFTQLLSSIQFSTEDLLLASIFGGFAYGIGLGIIFVVGGTTGGTDILGRLIQIRFPHVSISIMMLIIDAAIILCSLAVFRDPELIMYGLIGIIAQTIALELLIKRLNVSKVAYVISDHGEAINDDLIANFRRGVTMLDAHGGYTRNPKKVIMCALKANEVEEFRLRVNKIDPQAFVIYTESQFIDGNGFVVYR